MNSPCRSAHSFAAGMEGRESAEEVTRGREEDVEEDHHDGDYASGRASQESTEHLTEHLNGLLSPLEFPPELARRILTHSSHPAAVDGHNAALTFMGETRFPYSAWDYMGSGSSMRYAGVGQAYSRVVRQQLLPAGVWALICRCTKKTAHPSSPFNFLLIYTPEPTNNSI